jgi:hypothetical protein
MARITFQALPVSGTPDGDYDGGVEMTTGSRQWKEENTSGSVSVTGIRIRRVQPFQFSCFGSYAKHQSLLLEPGEDEKLPPLPVGTKLYRANTWARPNDEGCMVLALDWAYYVDEIVRLMDIHVPGHTADQRRYVWNRLRSKCSVLFNEFAKPTFDIADPDDQKTTFDLGDDYAHVVCIDSRYPWLEPREPGWSIVLSDGGSLGEMVEKEWATNPPTLYHTEMDDNLQAAALSAFRKAYGSALHDDTGAEHRAKGRKLVVYTEDRVPFPEACKFGGFTSSQQRNFLAFEITKDGRYSKPKDKQFWMRDAVMIHRSGTHTRFLFWEHREMATQVGFMLKYIALIPVVISDSECARTMPVSPMRGMDPQITKAFYGNDYFASAFHHALNRRKYLHTLFPTDGRPVYHLQGTGILIRSTGDTWLRPNRGSSLGRKVSRARTYMADVAAAEATSTLPRNDILFGEVVQPVAVAAPKRRALMLDM